MAPPEIKQDEVVTFFPTFGSLENGTWALSAHGWTCPRQSLYVPPCRCAIQFFRHSRISSRLIRKTSMPQPTGSNM